MLTHDAEIWNRVELAREARLKGLMKEVEEVRMDSSIDSTLEERGKRYGNFEEHARISQNLKGVMRREEGWNRLADDQREALSMIGHKIARILNGDPDYADSWTDIAGYARLVEKRLLETEGATDARVTAVTRGRDGWS